MADLATSRHNSILIIGGGFAGISCALELATDKNLSVTILDKNNYQQFQPLLYQVATGLLASSNAAFAIREILREFPNVDVQMARIDQIDLQSRTVKADDGRQWTGDYLVLAMGSEVDFFLTPGAAQYSLPLYSLLDAEQLRSAIFRSFEAAGLEDSHNGVTTLDYVVVGGGPTGVELAGTLADTVKSVYEKEFGSASKRTVRIQLVERGRVLLKAFSRESQQFAATALSKRGVELRLGVSVEEVGADFVRLSDGTSITTRTVIWAAGLQPVNIVLSPTPERLQSGRLRVRDDLSLPAFDNVYAIGDLSAALGPGGDPLPQLAAVAQQAGKHVARMIVRKQDGDSSIAFEYRDRGILAMIGKNDAVAELGRSHHELTGPVAFAAWLGVHAILLPVVRAKMEAVLEWAWEYFTGDRPAQLIDREPEGRASSEASLAKSVTS
jgi:NADH dehydrogenase